MTGFHSASLRLKSDRNFVLEIVQIDGLALQGASEELTNDRELVRAAIQQNPRAFWHASGELQNDPEIRAAATARGVFIPEDYRAMPPEIARP